MNGTERPKVTLKWWAARGLVERQVEVDEIKSVGLDVQSGSHNPFRVRVHEVSFPIHCCAIEYPAWDVFGRSVDTETGQVHDCELDPGEIDGPSCASPVPEDRQRDTEGDR